MMNLNRKARRLFADIVKGLPYLEQLKIAVSVAGDADLGPATSEELKEAKRFADAVSGETFYHGGAEHLDAGDTLLAPKHTGADPCARGSHFLDREKFVFITNNANVASIYANKAGGRVFRVEPIGEIMGDVSLIRAMNLMLTLPKYRKLCRKHGPSYEQELYDSWADGMPYFTCESATILEVLE